MTQRLLVYVTTVAALCTGGFEKSLGEDKGATVTMTHHSGDARKCLSGSNVMEILPGSGWDNLQNTETAMVLSHNFSLCRTTEDQRYIIPDDITVNPLRTSTLDSFMEVMDNWSDYGSVTANGMNMDSGYDGLFDISGRFAQDMKKAKTRQMDNQTTTTRVQRRYVGYEAVAHPNIPLNPTFRTRLLAIAEFLESGFTKHARYASQELVKEFGTHVIIGVDAGAVWVEEDSFSEDNRTNRRHSEMLSRGSGGYTTKNNNSRIDLNGTGWQNGHPSFNSSLLTSRMATNVKSFGGNSITRPNLTYEEWAESLGNNLVAVDRRGELLDTFIKAEKLPELTGDTLRHLKEMVRGAIQAYYQMNTYPGCTDKRAVNFSPEANVDDGSCRKAAEPRPRNIVFRFGGVFQTCNCSDLELGDLCLGLQQINPSTGTFSCPTGYETLPLFSNDQQLFQKVNQCGACFFGIGRCCQGTIKLFSIQYKAFWCLYTDFSDKPELPKFPGFKFGGIYTSHVANTLTSSKTCPLDFIPLTLGGDIRVCVSDVTVSENSLPFAGFFSSSAGNPLAFGYTLNHSSLISHIYTRGPEAWPRRCPRGYSQRMIAVLIEDGCEIYYCIQVGLQPRPNRGSFKHPTLRRPPFSDPPSERFGAGDIYHYASHRFLSSENHRAGEEAQSFGTHRTREVLNQVNYGDATRFNLLEGTDIPESRKASSDGKQKYVVLVLQISNTLIIAFTSLITLILVFLIKFALHCFVKRKKRKKNKECDELMSVN